MWIARFFFSLDRKQLIKWLVIANVLSVGIGLGGFAAYWYYYGIMPYYGRTLFKKEIKVKTFYKRNRKKGRVVKKSGSMEELYRKRKGY